MRMKPYFGYWGKLDKKTHSFVFHQLAYHSLDVAAVAHCLLQRRKHFTRDMAHFVGIDADTFCGLIALVVALHDLGKFASAFQGLADIQNPDLAIVRSRRAYDAGEAHHDRLGYVFWMHLQNSVVAHICDPSKLDRRSTKRALDALTVLMECSLGHHGQPININEWRFLERDYLEPQNIDAATEFFADLADLIPVTVPVDILTDAEAGKRLRQLSWPIAGIVVLADL